MPQFPGRHAQRATRRRLRLLAAWPTSPRPPVGPEDPRTPGLTVYQGPFARGIAAGNRLVAARQVLRGDQP